MSKKKKPKAKPLRYFFYNDELHRRIHISRGDDLITAWNYPQGKTMKYVYSLVKRDGKPAFKTSDVANFLGRSIDNVMKHVREGNVRQPSIMYTMPNRKFYCYYWSEQDIMDLHAFLKTVHIGRPRADGRVSTGVLPTATELRSMIRQGTVMYVKVGEEFVPTFQADGI